jgi:hypothetical protein
MDTSDFNYTKNEYLYESSSYGNAEEILHCIQYASMNLAYEGSVFFSITDLDHNLTYRNQTYQDSLANKVSNDANQYILQIMERL